MIQLVGLIHLIGLFVYVFLLKVQYKKVVSFRCIETYILYFCIAYLLFSLGLMFFYGYEFIVEMIIYTLAETCGLLVSCYIIDYIIWWIGKKIFSLTNKKTKKERQLNQVTICQNCKKQYFSYRVTCPYCNTINKEKVV